MGVQVADNTIGAVVDHYRTELAEICSPEEARAITLSVFQHQLGHDPTRVLLDRDQRLSESELLDVYLPLKRLRSGEPLQYVLGQVTFHGLTLAVDPAVLIPRPETEELVQRIIDAHPKAPRTVVDIGTGSGCIALALKRAFPEATVYGVDVSRSALELAASNARSNALNVEWVNADVLTDPIGISGPLDLIVSNPPYIPEQDRDAMEERVLRHEPHLALFVKDSDPLIFYRRIAGYAHQHLAPGGTLWFETHFRGADDVRDLLEREGFRNISVASDLSGNPRFVHGHR